MKKEDGIMASKRGQAAMEFLMTYGWAIMVVLVVIGALAYFGVLSPDALLPEKCDVGPQIGCKDFKLVNNVGAAADTIQVILTNSAGQDMVIRQFNVSGDNLNGYCGFAMAATKNFRNGETWDLTLSTNGSVAGVQNCNMKPTSRSKSRFSVFVEYSWANSQSITHSLDGEIFARIEQ